MSKKIDTVDSIDMNSVSKQSIRNSWVSITFRYFPKFPAPSVKAKKKYKILKKQTTPWKINNINGFCSFRVSRLLFFWKSHNSKKMLYSSFLELCNFV